MRRLGGKVEGRAGGMRSQLAAALGPPPQDVAAAAVEGALQRGHEVQRVRREDRVRAGKAGRGDDDGARVRGAHGHGER